MRLANGCWGRPALAFCASQEQTLAGAILGSTGLNFRNCMSFFPLEMAPVARMHAVDLREYCREDEAKTEDVAERQNKRDKATTTRDDAAPS